MTSNHAWHSVTVDECLEKLEVTLNGLSASIAKQRLSEHGTNQIQYRKQTSLLATWLHQFNNILIYLLIIAAIITALLQHWIDAGVILGVVLLNAIISFTQENKAEKAIQALQKMLPLKANVIREGKRNNIDAKYLVPGDIVFLATGDKVPADLRLIKSNSLQIDEAILTGESIPIDKKPKPVKETTPLRDRQSMVYSGTLVTYGFGVGVVVATGMKTEVGKISSMLTGRPYFTTPLLRQLTRFGQRLAMVILCVALLLFLFGSFVRHYPMEEMFLAAVAIAVSFIPEGLPAIITIALAIGVTRMAQRHAIIRRLASVETLSSVTAICTDKTGTLTKNELTVKKIITSKQHYDVTGSGFNNEGTIKQHDKPTDIKNNPDLYLLLQSGVLCNDAELTVTNQRWQLSGNPVDGALLALGLKANLHYQNETTLQPRRDVLPFDSEHKLMASLHHDHQGHFSILVKGAPEMIVSRCSRQQTNGKPEPLDKAFWNSEINQLVKQGMRVLAIAFNTANSKLTTLAYKDVEHNLVLLGVVGIIDPPRVEARDSVVACQQAGITIKMVTGDHRLTAQAIAKQVGINDKTVLTGDNIDVLDDQELAAIVDDVDVYARTIPEHKIRLIQALRSKQQIVAMTGDGVNDAPALKNADIGIAMGIKGTDVAKEASEMVLADDNFASIKYAVEEGRNVYNNLKKAILFILPSSGGEGFVVLLAILFGYTLPITPLQILWVNLITTVTLALALAFERPEKRIMQAPPRDPKEPLLSKFILWRIAFVTLLYVICLFGLFLYELHQGAEITLARTAVVNLLVFLEALYLINCRRIVNSSLNRDGLFGSKIALVAIGIVVLLQFGFTYLPFMQYLFKTQPLNLLQWICIIIISLTAFFIIEIEKALVRTRKKVKLQ